MISHLKLKLAQAEEDVSCPAIYRLRAKLRELMKEGQTADQQVSKVVERSIETLVELSESCGDLRLENERLLSEVAELRDALAKMKEHELEFDPMMRTIDTTTVPEYVDIDELLEKLKNCEDTVADLRKQLDEKDTLIDSLNKELETMVSQMGLQEQIEAMAEELKRKDEKVPLENLFNPTNGE